MTSTPQQPVAELAGVTKRRGAVLALDGLGLSIAPGQCVALLGPNGAGKSTAVALLTGRLAPDSGTARLFGQDPRDSGARRRLGVMLQEAGLPQTLTVAEQVDLFRRYYPNPRPLDQVIALAGLSGLERRRCGKLSGGQMRRVHFALAISGQPDLLVLDEPTTGMDIEARRALWASVRAEIARGAAVLLTTHHLDEAEALADRIVVVDRGRVIADGPPHAIKAGAAAAAIRCRTRLTDRELNALPEVASVSRDGGRVTILTSDAAATLRPLLARDESLSDLTVAGATLEDAFTRLLDAQNEAQNGAEPTRQPELV